MQVKSQQPKTSAIDLKPTAQDLHVGPGQSPFHPPGDKFSFDNHGETAVQDQDEKPPPLFLDGISKLKPQEKILESYMGSVEDENPFSHATNPQEAMNPFK